MTSPTMVAAVGDETRFAYADVIAPPFKVKESARTRASNNLAILACMARVDQNRSFMSRTWVVADCDEALIPPKRAAPEKAPPAAKQAKAAADKALS